MSAKVLYTKSSSDPTTIIWPPRARPEDQFTFTSGTTVAVSGLIGYGDGSITYPDGRPFPAVTPGGSTFAHQK